MERMKQTVLFCINNSPRVHLWLQARRRRWGGRGINALKQEERTRGKPITHRIIPLVARLSAAALDSRGERRDGRPARSSWLFVAFYVVLLSL